MPALPATYIPTSPYQPPYVLIGLCSLLRWWNFFEFPAWKRSNHILPPHEPLSRSPPQPNTLTDPRVQRHSARLHLWTVFVPEGLGAPFGEWLRRGSRRARTHTWSRTRLFLPLQGQLEFCASSRRSRILNESRALCLDLHADEPRKFQVCMGRN